MRRWRRRVCRVDCAVDHGRAHHHHRAGHDHQQYVDDHDDGAADAISLRFDAGVRVVDDAGNVLVAPPLGEPSFDEVPILVDGHQAADGDGLASASMRSMYWRKNAIACCCSSWCRHSAGWRAACRAAH